MRVRGPIALLMLFLLALAVPSQAGAQSSTYHPIPAARDFKTGPGGWTSGFFSSGPCLAALTCPEVTNAYVGTGGADGEGDGFLRSTIDELLGDGGDVSTVWRSGAFIYRGAAGIEPETVEVNIDRRARVDAFLSVSEDTATYTVEMVDRTAGGDAVVLTGPEDLDGASRWTAAPTVSVDPGQLTIGHEYFLRIVTRFGFGVEIAKGGQADYDNVVVTALGEATGSGACSVELRGSPDDDSLGGGVTGDRIKALAGDDEVFGIGGDDCLFGNPGDDSLFGGDGSDELSGNQGSDELGGGKGRDDLSGGAQGDRLRGGKGGDKLRGGIGDDSLRGGGGRDEIRGNSGNDDLRGGGKGDRLIGGVNSDQLRGLGGKDRLNGGSGADVIRGGGGGDRISGGAGRDRVVGGNGSDRINVRGGGRDKVNCGPGRDRVNADRRDKVSRSCERVKIRG